MSTVRQHNHKIQTLKISNGPCLFISLNTKAWTPFYRTKYTRRNSMLDFTNFSLTKHRMTRQLDYLRASFSQYEFLAVR